MNTELEHERMRRAIERRLFARDVEAVRVGRFDILDRLGEGGMGVVYRGFDPELGRPVAIKLLTKQRKHQSARMHREAQALARLSHPNVVTVHDVGIDGDRLYIAMELVEGLTLDAWAERHRNEPGFVEAALDLLEQAAMGLWAAHAAGVIHRDLKPSNMLVGDDGRLRLADFGLARTESNPEDEGEATVTQGSSEQLASAGLTATGAVLGTPAYMAPEQLDGQAVPATDQFSLCVAFFEILVGNRPFPAEPFARVAAVARGDVDVPDGCRVPRWVRRLLARGLMEDPEARFADVDALLAAVRRGRTRGRRRGGLAVTGAAVLGVGAWWLDSTPPSCDADTSVLETAWGHDRREAVEAAFARAPGWGPESFERVAEDLDGLARSWEDDRKQACLLTYSELETDAARGRSDAACLDRAVESFAFLTEYLAGADDQTLARASDAVATLRGLARCEGSPAVLDVEDIELLANLDRAVMLVNLGDPEGAEALVNEVLERGDPPAHRILARAYRVRARSNALGDQRKIYEALRGQLEAAEIAGDPELTVDAWLGLARALATRNPMMARFMVERARRYERTGQATARMLVEMDAAEGAVEQIAGKSAQAIELIERALEGYERVGTTSRERQMAHFRLAKSYLFAESTDAATTAAVRGLELCRAVYGARHPHTIRCINDAAEVFGAAGDEARALTELDQAIEIAKDYAPLPKRKLGELHLSRAQSHIALGHPEAALADAEQGVSLLGHGDATVSDRLRGIAVLARTLAGADRHASAEEAFASALELADAHADELSSTYLPGMLHLHRAANLAELGRATEAIGSIDAAVELLSGIQAPESPTGLEMAALAGRVLTAAGELDRAEAMLRTALGHAKGQRPFVLSLQLALVQLELHRNHLDDAREALATFETTLGTDPEPPELMQELVEVRSALGIRSPN